MDLTPWIIAITIAYLSGSVPYALLIGWSKGVDLRYCGSGNIGATNCGREVGKRWGLLCFALDLLKGLFPVVAAGWWFGLLGAEPAALDAAAVWLWLAVAVAAVVGHVAPVWLGFRGGKGVATGFGVGLGMWPFLTLPALAAGATWVLFLAVFRYVGLASVVAAMALPFYFALAASAADWPEGGTWPFLLALTVMALIVVVRHRSNLTRLWLGTEERVGE